MAKGADNPFSYEGKRVVITGAYSGVGAALLELIDSLGAEHITVVDLKEPSGPATEFVQADLSDQAAVDRAVAAIDGWDESLAWIAARPELFADPYALSKECMQVYTMWSARDAQRRGLRVNSVCPSPIETPLLPDFRQTMSDKTIDWCIEESGRVAQPRDIALVLAFLGTDASGFVNGVNLNVDLGFSAGMAMGQVDFGALMA